MNHGTHLDHAIPDPGRVMRPDAAVRTMRPLAGDPTRTPMARLHDRRLEVLRANKVDLRESERFPHRGYLVTHNTMTDRWFISHNHAHIAVAATAVAARRIIDAIAGPAQEDV